MNKFILKSDKTKKGLMLLEVNLLPGFVGYEVFSGDVITRDGEDKGVNFMGESEKEGPGIDSIFTKRQIMLDFLEENHVDYFIVSIATRNRNQKNWNTQAKALAREVAPNGKIFGRKMIQDLSGAFVYTNFILTKDSNIIGHEEEIKADNGIS